MEYILINFIYVHEYLDFIYFDLIKIVLLEIIYIGVLLMEEGIDDVRIFWCGLINI